MKKLIFYLFICSIMLCACNAADEDNGSSTAGVNMTTGSVVTATESAVTAAGVAATVSGVAVEKKQLKKEKKKIIRIVTDETRRPQKLKLETVNTKKKGIYFSSADWATNYSQVQDGHYYYIRSKGDEVTYTIYQDKKKKVGEFSLEEYINKDRGDYPELIGMSKYKKKFYIFFDYLDDDWEDVKYESDDGWDGATVLAYIDLKKKAVKLWDMTRTRIDEDYIYCQEYLIPRSGGKMIKAFADAKVFESLYNYSYITKSISYSYNKKYIFYIDKNYKVHRIDKKTGRNHIISSLKAVGVDCTEDSVYIKVHAKAWYDDKKGMWKGFEEDEEGDLSYD